MLKLTRSLLSHTNYLLPIWQKLCGTVVTSKMCCSALPVWFDFCLKYNVCSFHCTFCDDQPSFCLFLEISIVCCMWNYFIINIIYETFQQCLEFRLVYWKFFVFAPRTLLATPNQHFFFLSKNHLGLLQNNAFPARQCASKNEKSLPSLYLQTCNFIVVITIIDIYSTHSWIILSNLNVG